MESELLWLWATVAASLLYYLTSLRRRSATGRLPPGPTALPVVGNLLNLGGNFHHSLASLARAHGPVMTIKLGFITAVIVSSRDAAWEAFTKHDRRLAARTIPDSRHALGHSGRSMAWLPSSNRQWKTVRGIVAAHIFSPRSLGAARAVRERKVRDIVNYFRGHAGEEVEVGPAVNNGLFNLITNVLFSADVIDVDAEFPELMEDIVSLLAKPNVSDFYPFLRLLDLQGIRRWTARHMNRVFSIFNGIIDRRLAEASEAKHGDVLDSLLELMSTGQIPRQDVLVILFDLFAAGSDTTTLTVEWAMAELLRNPSVMANVRAEIKDILGGKATMEEPDVANMPYLQAVVKEAMRLHPVAPLMLPHKAVEDGVEIGGYAVPKGSTVLFNSWAIMRDSAAWEKPDEFLPERFFGKAEVGFWGKQFEFIPLGTGRRLCPGLPMVELVVPFIVASLVHAFVWQLPDGVTAEDLDVTERYTAKDVLVMATPLKAVPVVPT